MQQVQSVGDQLSLRVAVGKGRRFLLWVFFLRGFLIRIFIVGALVLRAIALLCKEVFTASFVKVQQIAAAVVDTVDKVGLLVDP